MVLTYYLWTEEILPRPMDFVEIWRRNTDTNPGDTIVLNQNYAYIAGYKLSTRRELLSINSIEIVELLIMEENRDEIQRVHYQYNIMNRILQRIREIQVLNVSIIGINEEYGESIDNINNNILNTLNRFNPNSENMIEKVNQIREQTNNIITIIDEHQHDNSDVVNNFANRIRLELNSINDILNDLNLEVIQDIEQV